MGLRADDVRGRAEPGGVPDSECVRVWEGVEVCGRV